jgi:hypothetical protein
VLPGASTFPGISARTIVEEINVSDAMVLQAPLAVTTSTTMAFNFSSAIPINASDLVLQVVFRGKMGTEDDAVVVGHERHQRAHLHRLRQ